MIAISSDVSSIDEIEMPKTLLIRKMTTDFVLVFSRQPLQHTLFTTHYECVWLLGPVGDGANFAGISRSQ